MLTNHITLMDRTKASIAYLNGTNGYGYQAEDRKIFAFLSLFHPEMSLEKRFKIIRERHYENNQSRKTRKTKKQ